MNTTDYQEKIESQFISFCKLVVRHELINDYHEKNRWNKKFVSFEELSERQIEQLSTYDDYLIDNVEFQTNGHIVLIEHEILAKAMAALSERKREVILRSFLLNEKDSEIARVLGIKQCTVYEHKNTALDTLRKIMEDSKNE